MSGFAVGWLTCRDMQEYIASLQTEFKAATAAADLEKTLKEFKEYLENGKMQRCLSAQSEDYVVARRVMLAHASFVLVLLGCVLAIQQSCTAARPEAPR